MVEYFNLLNDSLRNGYQQVIQIYNKIETALNEDKVINVCTGYLNSPFQTGFNNLKVFLRGKNIPICYKSANIGLFCNKTVTKVLQTYAKWLKSYDMYLDNDILKQEVDEDLKLAKKEYDEIQKQYLFQDKKFEKPEYYELKRDKNNIEFEVESSFIDDEQCEADDNCSLNSFIAKDDEEDYEDEGEEEVKAEIEDDDDVDNLSYDENEYGNSQSLIDSYPYRDLSSYK